MRPASSDDHLRPAAPAAPDRYYIAEPTVVLGALPNPLQKGFSGNKSQRFPRKTGGSVTGGDRGNYFHGFTRFKIKAAAAFQSFATKEATRSASDLSSGGTRRFNKTAAQPACKAA